MHLPIGAAAVLTALSVAVVAAPAHAAEAAPRHATTVATHHVVSRSGGPPTSDLRITWGRGVYLNGWGSEWRLLAAGATGTGGVLILAGCVIQRAPARWLYVLRTFCATVGAGNARWVLRVVRQAYGQRRFELGSCYQIRFPAWGGSHIHRVRARGNCYAA
jgi:hypothetical protein